MKKKETAPKSGGKKRQRGRRSIKTRFFINFFSLAFGIICLIAISFNFVAHSYVESAAADGLREAVALIRNSQYVIAPQSYNFEDIMRQVYNLVRDKAYITDAQLILADENYRLIYPTDSEYNIEEYTVMLEELKKTGQDIGSITNQRLNTQQNSYYITAIAVDTELTEGYQYILLFMDITNISALVYQLNLILMAIAVIAALLAAGISILSSEKIAKPIQQLSVFAAAIGKGDFTKRTIDSGDREIAELLTSMNNTADQLERYDKEQKTFFQNVSHELRTPLMSIRGYAEGIKYEVFDNNIEAANVIIHESDRLNAMVEDLLYISRIDSNHTQWESTECDLREILSNCVDQLKGLVVGTSKQVHFQFVPDPVIMSCDEKAISRAFTNVISNAIRYANQEVNIACSIVQQFARIEITDDGPGISDADMPHIFDRFYKGEGGNHGIGLSITKSIVEQHGGRIFALNVYKGARFVIDLPLGARQ